MRRRCDKLLTRWRLALCHCLKHFCALNKVWLVRQRRHRCTQMKCISTREAIYCIRSWSISISIHANYFAQLSLANSKMDISKYRETVQPLLPKMYEPAPPGEYDMYPAFSLREGSIE